MNATSATVLLLASSLFNLCDPDPKPVTESECWSHSASTERQSCSEEGEPDDDLFTARHVAAPTCSPQKLEGTLSGNDVDVVKANRAPLCESEKSHPTLTLDTAGVRACLFVQCSTGSTGLGGCSSGLAMHLPSGLVGCCLSEPGTVTGTFDCSSRKRQADAYIIVDGSDDECRDYHLEYQF
jgi:hypothetical protein